MLKPIFIKILFFTRLTSNTLSLFIRQGSWLRCGNQILFPLCHIWLVLYFFWVTPLEQWGLWAIVVSIALSEHQSGGTLLGRLVSKGHVLGKQLHVSQWSFVLWLFFPHFAQCLSYFFVIENLFIVDDDPEALAFWAFLLDSSWITWSMIGCNLYFVISSMLSRYWQVVSWYELGRAEQNMKTTRSSMMLEWPLESMHW